jgi:hypothetical protein
MVVFYKESKKFRDKKDYRDAKDKDRIPDTANSTLSIIHYPLSIHLALWIT